MKERNIIYERGNYWVTQLPWNSYYCVMHNVGTHAQSEATCYRPNADGLSIAKARVDYLAERAERLKL